MRRSVGLSTALVYTATLLGTLLPASSWAAAAAPGDPTLVNETFTRATADPAFVGYGTACLTGAPQVAQQPPTGEHPLGGCPEGIGPVPPPDADPHGYLRLTDRGTDRSAAALYTTPVPANEGLRVSFDQWQYGGNPADLRPADGISFFLVDGAGTLSAPGAFGGSLGYAQKLPNNAGTTILPGVDHGYVGLGLDVLGNYFGDWEHRGNGCTPPEVSPAGTSFLVPAPGPNVITLRGPGDGTRGYCWLKATATPPASGVTPWQSTLPGDLQGPTTSVPSDPAAAEAALEPSRRRVTVAVTPAPNPVMTVSVDFNDGRGAQQVMDTPLPQPVPATYKFGFGASTGSFTDVHLIRNVAVGPFHALPQLNLVKQLSLDQPAPDPVVAGSRLHYQFVVTNSGNVPLTDIRVHDPVVGPVACPATTLRPAETVTCTAAYTVTAADVSRGSVQNVAFATGTADDQTVTSPEAEHNVPIARDQVLELDKTVDDTHPYQPGDLVTYHYAVTNTSPGQIDDLAVHDDHVTGITCQSTTLTPAGTPGAGTTCTGTYTVTEADAAAGHVTNTAHASGTAAGRPVTSPEDQATIQTRPEPLELNLVKQVDNTRTYSVGDQVTYRYTVTNASRVPVTDLVITDDHVTGITCGATTLAPSGSPGDSTICTGTYTVTEADALAGHVTNTAHVSGTAGGETVTSPDEQARIDTEVGAVELNLVKQVDNTRTYSVGDQVTYRYTVTNASRVTVTDLVVRDDHVSPVTCDSTTLAPSGSPGDSTICTGTYTVTEADAVAGHVTNTARAAGTAAGETVTSPDEQARIDTEVGAVELNLVKQVDNTRTYSVGDQVTYHYTVTNASRVPVTDLVVRDDHVSPVTCDSTTLAPSGSPGDSTNCTGTYTVTEADAVAGHVTNTAHAAGTAAGETVTSPDEQARIDTEVGAVKLNLAKQVDNTRVYEVGDKVTYHYTVTNASRVTVTDLVVHDDRVASVTCPTTTLAPSGSPGDSTTCTGTYTVTEADALAGNVTNTAHASGTAAGETVTSPPTQAEIRVAPVPVPPPSPTPTPTPPPTPTPTPTPIPRPKPGRLPATGENLAGLLWAAVALPTAGMLLLGAARRRRPGKHD